MGGNHGMSDFNRDRFEAAWEALNVRLNQIRSTGGLPGVIDALREQQFDRGFIQDDLREVIKYRIIHGRKDPRYFIVQYNPKRALRSAGAGRAIPPPGAASVNGGCFLCRENIRWQQRGVEAGFDIAIGSGEERRRYILWMNPFPLMPNHVTVASVAHRPQSWLRPVGPKPGPAMGIIIRDFLKLVGELPGYVGFYNGEGAGATIPQHFHFQFFKRPDGQGVFPLERAARQGMAEASNAIPKPRLVSGYPITAIHFYGPARDLIEQTVWVTQQWEALQADKAALTANLIGTPDSEREGFFHLFFIPRDKTFSRGPGMVGIIAGLELLGEMVFSTEEEKRHLDLGMVDYHYVERIIASVEAPRGRELWEQVATFDPGSASDGS